MRIFSISLSELLKLVIFCQLWHFKKRSFQCLILFQYTPQKLSRNLEKHRKTGGLKVWSLFILALGFFIAICTFMKSTSYFFSRWFFCTKIGIFAQKIWSNNPVIYWVSVMCIWVRSCWPKVCGWCTVGPNLKNPPKIRFEKSWRIRLSHIYDT